MKYYIPNNNYDLGGAIDRGLRWANQSRELELREKENTRRETEFANKQQQDALTLEKQNMEMADLRGKNEFQNSLKDIGTEGQGLSSIMKARAQQARVYGQPDEAVKYDALAEKAKNEGITEAMRALAVGDFEGAISGYNSKGDDRVLRYEPVKQYDGDRRVKALYENGSEVVFDPKLMLKRFDPDYKDPDAEYGNKMFEHGLDINKEAAKEEFGLTRKLKEIDAQTKADIRKKNAEVKAEGGAGGGSPKDASKVLLNSDKWVTESDLRGTYERQYGKYDPEGNLFMDEKAPRYMDWRNNVVKPEFKFNENPAQPVPPQSSNANQSPTDWRAYDGGGNAPASQPAQKPAPGGLTARSRLDSLKTADQIAAEKAMTDQTRIPGQVKAARGLDAARRDKMASDFGMKPGASNKERGAKYNEAALAMTGVQKSLKSGVVPSKSDLEAAYVLAENNPNAPVSVDEIAELYARYYVGGNQ